MFALKCDVSDKKQVEKSFAKVLDEMGEIHACFANAGIGILMTPFHEMSIDEWRRVFGINMEGVFFTFQSAVRHMMERGNGGSLVVTSSLSSNFGMPRGEHYAAAKTGLIAIIRSLAVEYARYGIRANAIIPGWIETDMTTDFFKLKILNSKMFRKEFCPACPSAGGVFRPTLGRLPFTLPAMPVFITPVMQW
jgi:NAD(P)-dependent dehydrogenase (short-subunit alcohol dehydrogenase family)